MELQKMWVTLALKADEFGQGLDDARGRAEGFASQLRGRVGGALGTLATVGRAAFLGVGAAAVGGFGAAMGAAISMNASLESSTLQFTTLMGDADKATAHVQDLFTFAANTPYESQEIINASLKLQTFGGAALNTMENLTLVGDAAAAVNAPIDEVAFWIGRLYSNLQGGQPFGEAAARLQELGIMTPQVRTEMEAMQASGASANEMWTTMQGNLGNFTGAMELQAGTWSGLLSTIKDNLMMAAAEGLKPFFDIAKQGLEALSVWLSSPEVQAGIQNIAAGLATLVQGIATFVQEHVIPFVQEHGPQLKEILIALAAAFAGLLVIGAVVTAIGLLTNPIALIAAAIGALAAAWVNNWGGIRDKTEAVVNFIRPLIEGFLNAIRAFWEAHGAAIMAAARAAWEGIKAGIETVVNVIRTVVTNFLAAVRGFWEAHGQAIMKAATDAWNLIRGVIEGVVETIKDIVDAFRLAFQGDWEGFGRKIFEIWKDAWDTVINFLRGLWAMVLPWLASLWESIKGWFTRTDWGQLGRNIIAGIVKGLADAGQAIVDTIAGFAQAAWAQVKAFFGISSPSTLMYWAGTMIGQGLIEGIQAMAAPLAETMDALFKKMGDIANLGGGFANIFKDKTIDPILGRLDELKDGIEVRNDSIGETVKRLGLDMAEPGWELMLNRFATSEFSSFEQRALAQNALALLGERRDMTLEQVELQKELAAQQERIAAIEERRAQIGFLQQQLDLIKMIKDNNLDASILDGIKLGLDADAGGLMDAMAEAMRRMIEAAEDELGVHSPSRWAQGLMQNVIGTMAATAERERSGLQRSLSRVLGGALEPVAAMAGPGVGAQTADNSRRTVVNGGVHNYYGAGRGSALDEMEVLMR